MNRWKTMIVPGATITRVATGATRTIISVEDDNVTYRDEFGESECSFATMRSWLGRPTKAERNARRKARCVE